MPLDPFKDGGHTSSISCVNQLPYINDEVLVDHFATCRGLPAILDPALVPKCRTIDRVVAVGDNLNFLTLFDNLKGSLDGCEFCTLVGLRSSFQGFRHISIN